MLTSRALKPLEVREPSSEPAVPSSAGFPVTAVTEIGSEYSNPAVKIAFYGGLIFLFLRLGAVPEIVFSLTKTSTPILYIVAVPAFLGALFAGGVIRTLRSSAARFWLLFFAWMIVAVPFSTWLSGSISRVILYLRDDLPLLFIIGGLAVNWKQVRAAFYTIAAAAVFNLVTTQLFARVSGGRLDLAEMTETLGNPNDLASQLLLVLPFVLFVVLRNRNIAVRVLLLGAIGYGIYVALSTASRGGLIAMGLQFAVFLFCASPRARLAAFAAAMVLVLAVPVMLSHETVDRLSTVFGNSSIEAEQSAVDRSYLFHQSVRYTIQHPLFGVGPDQFLNYEGGESQSQGLHGLWHVTHCAYTQVSSECGIPGLIFFIAGLVSALVLVGRLFQAAKRTRCAEVGNACLCYLVGMTGYLGAISFLSSAYSFHLPAMVGLAISMSFAGHREIAKRGVRAANPPITLSQPRATFAGQ